MKATAILLKRNKTQLITIIKKATRGVAILSISLLLLISIIALKTYKTELGYKLTKSKNNFSKVLMENKKLRSLTLKLKSHERIESIAIKNNMKFPSQRDVIKINNE
ncbi:hypothetical protein CL651_002235 [bacterium]|nr:hypothetical protein [bacterium]|tara:strand:- start:1479 stop:1799 length:321 start_codon:yes stop_codon:yes gene_type:complete